MTKTISLLGATGSVGQSTFELIRAHPDKFQVQALTAYSRVDELATLAKEFNAKFAVIGDETKFEALKAALSGTNIGVAAGEAGLLEAADYAADIVLSAIVGAAGLRPTLTAVRRGAAIVLANKECLVCAGDLMMDEVAKHGATLLPADSEHNAIFQVFDAERTETVSKLILTASGGPFLNNDINDMADITPAQAVAHPNWDMGAKISVDSATMMNKGLEVIEAYHLFPVGKEQIEVLVHPQSVIHSMVEYIDGSTLAQLGPPDMVVPLASCLAWPERITAPVTKLNLAEIGKLTFETPDYEKFRCLALARNALLAGGAATTVLNAANEIAVDAFLREEISFLAISKLVEETLTKSDMKVPYSLANVFEIDAEARRLAQSLKAGIKA